MSKKTLAQLFLFAFGALALLAVFPASAHAQTCYPERVFHQWECVGTWVDVCEVYNEPPDSTGECDFRIYSCEALDQRTVKCSSEAEGCIAENPPGYCVTGGGLYDSWCNDQGEQPTRYCYLSEEGYDGPGGGGGNGGSDKPPCTWHGGAPEPLEPCQNGLRYRIWRTVDGYGDDSKVKNSAYVTLLDTDQDEVEPDCNNWYFIFFDGWIYIPETGDWQFKATTDRPASALDCDAAHDADSNVKCDDHSAVVDNIFVSGNDEWGGAVSLTKGWHFFYSIYTQRSHHKGIYAQLYFKRTDDDASAYSGEMIVPPTFWNRKPLANKPNPDACDLLPTCSISELNQGFASGGTIDADTTLKFSSIVTLDEANITKDPDITQFLNNNRTFIGATTLSSKSSETDCPVGNTTCQTTKTHTFNQPGTFYAFCNGLNDDVGECRPFENTPETADCGPSDEIQINVVQPVGDVKASARLVSPSANCTNVANSTDYLDNTVFSLSPAVIPASLTQTSGNPVFWNDISVNTYTLSAELPVLPVNNYVLRRACYSKTGGAPWTQSLSAELLKDETITWNLGFMPVGPWVQTQAGDVYAKTSITSLIPGDDYFNLDGSGGYPGVVVYGGSGPHPYDFDIGSGYGEDKVSSKGWLVNDRFDDQDFYALFYHKFGAPTTPDTFPDLNNVTKPSPRSAPYYVVGDMATSGNWTINNGQNIVFLIEGNLTINGKINLVGSGFIAFIVRGNITIAPEVGSPPSPTTSTLEGIYIAGGSFNTGSSISGKERLVGTGIFIANSFSRERNLEGAGGNVGNSAELYIYNPRLLLTMPAQMKDVSIIWEEVAP